MQVVIEMARGGADERSCRNLVQKVYGREYGVSFRDGHPDPDAKLEGYPDRFLAATCGGELVGTIGLYASETYVERFGGVTQEDIAAAITAAGACAWYRPDLRRELTRLTVRPEWRGMGVARALLVAAHAREFLDDGGARHLVLSCARSGLVELVVQCGIRLRTLKAFPRYAAHERYGPGDPMESRLSLPLLDVPAQWHDLRFPARIATHAVDDRSARTAAVVAKRTIQRERLDE